MQNTNRLIRLSGAANFRDIGGLPTKDGGRMRSGILFRSDELSRLTGDDAQILADLNLRLICDLRTPNEGRSKAARLPLKDGLRIVPVPIMPHAEDMTRLKMFGLLLRHSRSFDFENFLHEYYHTIIFERPEKIREVLALLAEPDNLPAVIHCTAGKDRTGLIAALLQLLAGVPRDLVLEDYMDSNHLFADRKQELLRKIRWLTLFQISPERLQHLLEVRQEYLNGVLDEIYSHYDSIPSYLVAGCGVPEIQVDALRKLLLE